MSYLFVLEDHLFYNKYLVRCKNKFINRLNMYIKYKKKINFNIFTNVGPVSDHIELRREYLEFLNNLIDEKVHNRVKQLTKFIQSFEKAIHIRVGDHIAFNCEGTDERVTLEEAEKLCNEYWDHFIFTDSFELKKKFPLRTLPTLPCHSGLPLSLSVENNNITKDNIIDTFSEFLIIGKFNEVKYKKNSMFSKISTFLHKKEYIQI